MREISISDVVVQDRHRKQFRNMDALKSSIQAVGLLQPIVVRTRDKRLIAGERRLRACKELGWEMIPVRLIDLDAIVQGEHDENAVRDDLLPSEKVALGLALEEEMGERRGRPVQRDEIVEKIPQLEPGVKTRDVAAEKAGFGNPKTYEQAKKVVEGGSAKLVEAMDAGTVSISDAAAIVELPKAEQNKAVQAVASGDARTLRAAAGISATTRTPKPAASTDAAPPPPEANGHATEPVKPEKTPYERLKELESAIGAVVRLTTETFKVIGKAGFGKELNTLLDPYLFRLHQHAKEAKKVKGVTLWPHQEQGAEQRRAVNVQGRSPLIACPTGGGKTLMQVLDALETVQAGGRVLLITNRRLLTDQLEAEIDGHGLEYGMLASGCGTRPDAPIQIARLQTLASRVLESKTWELPKVDKVIVDEAHTTKGPQAETLLAMYRDRGVVRNGYTATPVGLSRLYDELVIAGTNSELRATGALIPCNPVIAPTEPETNGIRWQNISEDKAGKRIMQCLAFGHVFDSWRENHPESKSTILWAPGQAESRWFVEEFEKRGFTAAHVDGDTPGKERHRIIQASREGEIAVLCSCGVFREGANMPWLVYGILVQACVNLSTYLQIVGRLLRAHPGKDSCALQDHAGAWWRHGSPNMDRKWKLSDTDKTLLKSLFEARRNGESPEPIRCPKCSGIRAKGPKCPHCGHEHTRSVRAVVMEGGEMKKAVGNVVKPKKKPTDEGVWKQVLFAAGRSGKTVGQAVGMFKQRTGRWPEMPNAPGPGCNEWHQKVSEVYPWTCRKCQKAQ